MKIDINTIDRENFDVTEREIAGDMCYLVQPNHIGTKFNQQNKIFRSSIWNKDGEPVSLSFKKFVNMGENPENFPPPTSLDNCNALLKLDGSCLIFSIYKRQQIIRTRGQFDVEKMPNKDEIDILKKKHPTFWKSLEGVDNTNRSYIFEWVSPNNQVVLLYDEPDFILTGIIEHSDYSYWTQRRVDSYAEFHGFKRPKTFKFGTLSELIESVSAFKGMEGICLYSNDDQEIFKIKGEDYLIRHRMKSELGNIENVVDLFINAGCPNYNEFYSQVSLIVDFELEQKVRGFISNICDAYKQVLDIVDGMKRFVEPLKSVPRKDAALKITSSYGTTNRASFVFQLLDSKSLQAKDIKKLIWQCLKK